MIDKFLSAVFSKPLEVFVDKSGRTVAVMVEQFKMKADKITHLSINIQSTSMFSVITMKFTAVTRFDVECSVVV